MTQKIETTGFCMTSFEVIGEVGCEAACLLAYMMGARDVVRDTRTDNGVTYYRFSDTFICNGLHVDWSSDKVKKLLDTLVDNGYIVIDTVPTQAGRKRYIAICSSVVLGVTVSKNVVPVQPKAEPVKEPIKEEPIKEEPAQQQSCDPWNMPTKTAEPWGFTPSTAATANSTVLPWESPKNEPYKPANQPWSQATPTSPIVPTYNGPRYY